MKISIRGKLFVLCMLSVLVTGLALSITYYLLIMQEKHRASQQRIHVAFKIIFDDLVRLSREYSQNVVEFLQKEESFALAANLPIEQIVRAGGLHTYLESLLSSWTSLVKMDQAAVFNLKGQQLAAYQQSDIDLSTATEEKTVSIFEEDIPEQVTTGFYRIDNRIGLKIIAPIRAKSNLVGVLVGLVFLRPEMIDRYASLSETSVNFFADTSWSLGTLPAQSNLDPDHWQTMSPCDDLSEDNQPIILSSINVGGEIYSQGGCTIENAQGYIGAMTVSLPQKLEKAQVAEALKLIMIITLIAIAGGSGVSVLLSHKSILDIQESARIIRSASEGDLRLRATAKSRDEIGMLASSLNIMTEKLRHLIHQVQQASHAINNTAETIFAQMESLARHMEQQTQSVETTAGSVENITQFLDNVVENTSVLLSASSQILASIQETRASIAEITQSTGVLALDFQRILTAVDHINQSIQQISDYTGKLEETAQHTTSKMQQIGQFFQEVSRNAERTQYLARETMDAATRGEKSVEASLQGMAAIKNVVTDTAQIMQDISSWGEQVSGILGIVDDITEQTSLLALNAAIISAQAGIHGRGFAVVADEIKSLAMRTQSSTREISVLIHKLQQNTENGVQRAQEGLLTAEQGMQLAKAVNMDLQEILERATQSSDRATDNVGVVQRTLANSQDVSEHITDIAGMISTIRQALQQGATEFEQVVSSVENISGMAEKVNRANLEQKQASEEIERSMGDVTMKYSDISEQTDTLQRDVQQIVSAIQFIKSTTEENSRETAKISEENVKHLVQQSELLQSIVDIFKISRK